MREGKKGPANDIYALGDLQDAVKIKEKRGVQEWNDWKNQR